VGFARPLKIIQRENDYRFRVRQYLSRIASPLRVARQIIHFTCIAAIEPISKLGGVLRRFCPRESAKIKSDLTRQSDKLGTRVRRLQQRTGTVTRSTLPKDCFVGIEPNDAAHSAQKPHIFFAQNNSTSGYDNACQSAFQRFE